MKKGLTLFLYVFVIMSVVLFNKNKTADDMYAFRENQKNPYFDFEKNVFNDLNTKKKFLSLLKKLKFCQKLLLLTNIDLTSILAIY